MHVFRTPLRSAAAAAVALLLGAALIVSTAGSARALPVAEFTFSPSGPVPGEPVTFTFTGSCDENPPCAVDWRWFRDGGSRLGAAMGHGDEIQYAFPRAGTYRVVAKITNSGSTHGSDSATQALVVKGTFEDHDRAIRYDGWRGVADDGASAGGYRRSSGSNTFVSFAFSGPAITYFARTGPGLGIAAVTVDDRAPMLVDLYSPDPGTTSTTVEGLSTEPHRILVGPTGTGNPASVGTDVTLDEFVLGPDRVDDRSSAIEYGRWAGSTTPKAHGGSFRSSRSPRATTAFVFTGPTVTWLTSRGPDLGRAAVKIDGRRVDVVDLYASRRTWRVAQTYTGLTPGPHLIQVVALGRHDRRSLGATVTVDGFLLE